MYLRSELVFELRQLKFRRSWRHCLIQTEGGSQVIILLTFQRIKNSRAELHYALDIAVWRPNIMTSLKAITETATTGRNEGSRYQREEIPQM